MSPSPIVIVANKFDLFRKQDAYALGPARTPPSHTRAALRREALKIMARTLRCIAHSTGERLFAARGVAKGRRTRTSGASLVYMAPDESAALSAVRSRRAFRSCGSCSSGHPSQYRALIQRHFTGKAVPIAVRCPANCRA